MMESLISIFSVLEDPRDNRCKKHLLIHVIILAIYGILCGYTDFSNMAYYLKKREKELSEEFGLFFVTYIRDNKPITVNKTKQTK